MNFLWVWYHYITLFLLIISPSFYFQNNIKLAQELHRKVLATKLHKEFRKTKEQYVYRAFSYFVM